MKITAKMASQIYDITKGGYIKPNKKMTKKQFIKYSKKDDDTVPLIAGQINELVVPWKYVPLVSKFLKQKKIKFGNFH